MSFPELCLDELFRFVFIGRTHSECFSVSQWDTLYKDNYNVAAEDFKKMTVRI